MRNADKARNKPYAMTRHKKASARAKASTKHISKAMAKKQQRGKFHKLKKKRKSSGGYR